ncbi:MAG: Gfo/Idh/MocA family protein [Ilumatobacteraceae bacterium]
MIRWGFLGAGYVASRAMAPAVHAAGNAVLHAVASRDPQRSSSLQPLSVAAGYAELLEDPAVDAVYIGLANSQHLEWVMAALRAGKHVLCEKPLGITAVDVASMIATARRHDRLLVEAAWIRWHPRFRRFVDLASSGALGSLRTIDSAFTFENAEPENYRWSPAWGGGALLDVGCYQAHVWTAIAGAAFPVSVERVDRELSASGVDATTVADVRLDDRIAARLECSFTRPPTQRLSVNGDEHQLTMVDGEAFTSWREPSSLRVDDHLETFPAVDAFTVMVEAVSARLHGEDSWVVPIEDTLQVSRVLDVIAAHPVS